MMLGSDIIYCFYIFAHFNIYYNPLQHSVDFYYAYILDMTMSILLSKHVLGG
jgi:hypothetical protein